MENKIPGSEIKANFSELVNALQKRWNTIAVSYPKIEQITVIGIDLTKRAKPPLLKEKDQ